MTNQPKLGSALEGAPPDQGTIQQPISPQSGTTADTPTNSARPTTHDYSLQRSDSTTTELAGDDVPPPAYGEIYGEIRNEKDGLGTTARITDDGRVNIHINQVNRRLSQVFSPALRHQLEDVQDNSPPPSPYISSSLGGDDGVPPPPPPLNIVIQVVGSRGDVQPFVALGKVLKDSYGHRVRLATHPNFKTFVQDNGLEFFSIGGDPSRLMAFMVANPSLVPGFRSLLSGDVGQRRKDVAEYIQGCWRSCYESGDGMDDIPMPSDDDTESEPTARPFIADCIIANPPSFAHIHCAERLGIPLHIMFTMPYSPTQAFPHPLANIQSSNADPQLTNYVSYAMIELLSWQALGDIINRFRAKCLGLDPISTIWAPGMLQRLKIPHTYCWSPALIPKPKDWGSHISVSGFYFLNLASNYTPSPDLRAFLDAGAPPVYIGFGSIVLDDPNAMTELIFEAVRKTGQRILLSKGWGGIGADELHVPDGVFMLGNVPHDWLFNHVSCVVHHGGAGTTSAGITAGRPTVIVPFFGDQPFWGAMVARAGAGPDPIPQKQLTADKLADAINFCLKPESLERAKKLAIQIAAERGTDTGAQSFHHFLKPDQLRCTLSPSRAAVWQFKRTKVKLSAFAAYTLVHEGLLDFQDLRTFRSREHYTDEGPWDPISGGFTAFLGAVGGMSKGLADVPSETWKAVQYPIGRGRQLSQASVSTMASKSETSNARPEANPPVSYRMSQTSLPLDAHAQSSINDSNKLTPSPNNERNSTSGPSNEQQEHPNRPRLPAQTHSNLRKTPDMLRPTGVHVSKGAGRFLQAVVQGPINIAVNLTRGTHNLPKLWNDTTVRPQERVHSLPSGLRAASREFGFGWYDGVTGLVMQPLRGAQKEGAGGFVKGVGKGVGGFIAKPGAAVLGMLSHTLQGVSKEVQRLFGRDVQGLIIAGRVEQGRGDWLRSAGAERKEVVERWTVVQKYLKKKGEADDMMEDVLNAQLKKDSLHMQGPLVVENAAQSSSTVTSGLHTQNPGLETFPTAPETASAALETSNPTSQLPHHEHDTPNPPSDDDALRRALAASEADAQRHEDEARLFEQQLQKVLIESQRDTEHQQRWQSSE